MLKTTQPVSVLLKNANYRLLLVSGSTGVSYDIASIEFGGEAKSGNLALLLTKGQDRSRSRFIERKVSFPDRSHATIYIYRFISGIYGIDSEKFICDHKGQN